MRAAVFVFLLVPTLALAQDAAEVRKMYEAGRYQQVVERSNDGSAPAVVYTAAQSHQKLGASDQARESVRTARGARTRTIRGISSGCPDSSCWMGKLTPRLNQRARPSPWPATLPKRIFNSDWCSPSAKTGPVRPMHSTERRS